MEEDSPQLGQFLAADCPKHVDALPIRGVPDAKPRARRLLLPLLNLFHAGSLRKLLEEFERGDLGLFFGRFGHESMLLRVGR